MREENVPMDFYSWHCYGSKVSDFTSDARRHRAMLDRHGYTDTESILNEWNYVCGWSGDGWKRSLETEASLKGAAFIAAVMSACQREKPICSCTMTRGKFEHERAVQARHAGQIKGLLLR